MKTIELTIYELCEEVDELRQEVARWKNKYNDLHRDYCNDMVRHNNDVMKGVGQALLLAMSVREGENGSLVIPAEERKQLADSFTT